MKILVIGLGSIAKKHIHVLRNLISDVTILALRSTRTGSNLAGTQNIYSWKDVPDDLDFIIISNPTSIHAETILICLDFGVPLFIEKPVLGSIKRSNEIIRKARSKGIISYVACNLRFHPAIQFLKEEFARNIPIEFNSYCGSFLPDWRPNTDYRELYSAKKNLGGGVHLDLIHEIDYCKYLLGSPKTYFSYCKKKSTLEIDSIDIAHYVLEYDKTSVFITLNYYRRDPKREIECIWEDKTWIVDLLKNTIVNYKGEIVYSEKMDDMFTYTSQMKKFIEHVKYGKMPQNNIEEGVETLKIVLNE